MLQLLVQLFVKFLLFALRSRLSFLVIRQISVFAEAFWFSLVRSADQGELGSFRRRGKRQFIAFESGLAKS